MPRQISKNNLGLEAIDPYFCTPKNGGIDPWCNGNTTDFGSVIYGSNPYGSTKKGEIDDYQFLPFALKTVAVILS